MIILLPLHTNRALLRYREPMVILLTLWHKAPSFGHDASSHDVHELLNERRKLSMVVSVRDEESLRSKEWASL